MAHGTPSTSTSPTGLLPTLGLVTTTSLVVGGMIGSGIFRNPQKMAEFLHAPELLLGVWVLAGIVTMFGALTNAEVAGIIPVTGGQYQYFRTMYGDFMGFLYGWALFVVIQCGSIASITYVFAEYFNQVYPLVRFDLATEQAWAITLPFATIFPLENIGVKLLTVGAVTLLTLINAFGVREGGRVQVVFTVAKVGAMLALVLLAFTSSQASLSNVAIPSADAIPAGTALMLALAMAMSKALWSYDGWNNITYVSGEVRNPQINVPRALMIGTAITIAVYVLINVAYLMVLPIDTLRSHEAVAAEAARVLVGANGVAFIAVAVMIATIGTSNGTILASSRVYYAMALEKMFFRN